MRRRRACPTLALRRSPKVVVGLGVQGPSVLGERPGTGEAMAQVEYASSAPGHAVPEALELVPASGSSTPLTPSLCSHPVDCFPDIQPSLLSRQTAGQGWISPGPTPAQPKRLHHPPGEGSKRYVLPQHTEPPSPAAHRPPLPLTCHSQSPCTASSQGTRPGHPGHSLTSASSVGHSRLVSEINPSRPLQTPCLQLILADPYMSPPKNQPLWAACPELWGRPPPAPALFFEGPYGNKASQGRGAAPGPGRAGVDQGSTSFPHPVTKDPHAGQGSA